MLSEVNYCHSFSVLSGFQAASVVLVGVKWAPWEALSPVSPKADPIFAFPA